MHQRDHDLRQMDEDWLEKLQEDKLRQVSARILTALVEVDLVPAGVVRPSLLWWVFGDWIKWKIALAVFRLIATPTKA